MPNKMVIDLSHYNTIPSSLQPAKDAGVVGVIHKMTEGMGGVDAKVGARKFMADQAGLKWGLYHFLRPGNMIDQAHYFIGQANTASVLSPGTLLAADYEDERVSLADLQQFLTTVEDITGAVPVIYSGHVLKDKGGSKNQPSLTQYRLWLAQYTSGPPTLPYGWYKYWIWQWTDKGNVPGINPPVDCNDYQGTADELLDTWSGAFTPQPEPEPAPKPPTPIVRIIVPTGTKVVVEEQG